MSSGAAASTQTATLLNTACPPPSLNHLITRPRVNPEPPPPPPPPQIHRWLLRSPYRTLDADTADYFFVPTYLSLGFYDYEFGLYWLSARGNAFLRGVMEYVQARRGGRSRAFEAKDVGRGKRRRRRLGKGKSEGKEGGWIGRGRTRVSERRQLKVPPVCGESAGDAVSSADEQWRREQVQRDSSGHGQGTRDGRGGCEKERVRACT
eukprot:6186976-Pleurochrysis_carterae.AAC.2